MRITLVKLTTRWKHFWQSNATNEIFCRHWAPSHPRNSVKNLVVLGQFARSCLASGWQSGKKPTFCAERALDQEPCGPDGGKKHHQAEVLGHCASPFRARGAPQMGTSSIRGRRSPVWMETSGSKWGPTQLHFITETSGFPCFQASDLSRSLGEMSDVPWMPRLYFVDGFLENLANADSENTQTRKADSTGWTAEGFPNSHIPCHHLPPPPAQFLVLTGSVRCWLWSPLIYILLGMPLSLKETEHGLCCFSSHYQWFFFFFFFRLHILVICGGMRLRLMKMNDYLNTKDRVLMLPFRISLYVWNFYPTTGDSCFKETRHIKIHAKHD